MARRQGPPLEAQTAHLLARLGQRQSSRFTGALEPHGLRPRHFQVLNVIALEQGISQQELGRRLGLDPSGMVATLDDLQEAGYVERRRDPQDRRRHQLHLTGAGTSKLADARDGAQRVAKELLRSLTRDELARLHELLARVAADTDEDATAATAPTTPEAADPKTPPPRTTAPKAIEPKTTRPRTAS